jgi:diguanylate cyclase (GGDEF)-like protein
VLVVSLSGVLLVFMSILLVLSLKKKQSLLYNQSQEPENAGVQGIEYHGEQALHDARQKGCNFAVICFELDFLIGFDSLQADSASHALVNEVSNICQNQIRISDQFGRISDDRFIICLLDTTEQGALVLAERCREAIVALTNKNAEVSTPIKTTFGIAMIDDHQADFNEVTAAADKALLLAKNSDSEEIFIYCEEEAGN